MHRLATIHNVTDDDRSNKAYHKRDRSAKTPATGSVTLCDVASRSHLVFDVRDNIWRSWATEVKVTSRAAIPADVLNVGL